MFRNAGTYISDAGKMEQKVSKRRYINFIRRENGTECSEMSVDKFHTPGKWNRMFRNVGA